MQRKVLGIERLVGKYGTSVASISCDTAGKTLLRVCGVPSKHGAGGIRAYMKVQRCTGLLLVIQHSTVGESVPR